MYLYYLIGYKLVNSEIQQMKEKVKEDFESVQSIFERLPPSLVQQVIIHLSPNVSRTYDKTWIYHEVE